jgi:hypothetical protein
MSGGAVRRSFYYCKWSPLGDALFLHASVADTQ